MTEEQVKCPNCGSYNIEDISTYKSNDIVGPGFSTVKTFDVRKCGDCGVLFQPVKNKNE